MVDCGFNAYQLPMVPRACRSPRGRRLKPMRKQRSEFEVLTKMAGNFSGQFKNRVTIGLLAHETEQTKDNFVVNNFLETMEVEVKPQDPQPCLEKPSQSLLSKDWLALGPSLSSYPIIQEENFDSGFKIDGKRKMCYVKDRGSCSSQESQNMYPLKKRKLFYQNHRPESRDALCTGTGTVKLRIKSLKISEQLVEFPVSATVGSLKLAVLEAITRILKDGLNIGLLLRGKTIVDDSKTLLQIGIPRDDNDDHNFSSLGFMLEPHKSDKTTTTLIAASPRTRLRVLEPTEAVAAKSVVPIRTKPARQSEMVHRRIRRPFTVSEVEALVQAVERIGTGRWRDVKSHAFDHANHRTYVDLKDKWKTLVQQGKGEANLCLKTFLIGF